MKLHPIEAFSDNYIWILHDDKQAMVVDPGDASPVQAYLEHHGLKLDTILITHHHPDHVGGVASLLEGTDVKVIGPASEQLPVPVRRVKEGDSIEALGLTGRVLDVPGHTAGHVAYLMDIGMLQAPVLFCGDTLFSGGCGRLFEGTPAQMLASLDKLAALPESTRVCPAHEYTLSNLAFASHIEPDNQELQRYQSQCRALRANRRPTLPSCIGQERQINPFLRVREPSVTRSACRHAQREALSTEQVFAVLREWKNEFR